MFGRLYKVIGKFIPLIVVTIFNLHAQSYIITGKVTTSTGAVKYASVTFINIADTTKRFTAVTDSIGNYRLDIITSIRDNKNTIPTKFELAQNYPNPFSSSTSITYKLNKQSDISVKIYNILGQIVKEYNVGTQTTGMHGIVWDGRNNLGNRVAPGVYFYRLVTGSQSLTRKMLYGFGAGYAASQLSNSFTSLKKNFLGTSSLSLQSSSYKVEIQNNNNTKPKILYTELPNTVIQQDSTLNFQVELGIMAYSICYQRVDTVFNADGTYWFYFALYLNNITGTNPKRITTYTNDAYDYNPEWSPDGNYIAYMQPGSPFRICLYDTKNDTTIYLTPDSINANSPEWTPDSKHIVYNGPGNYFIIDRDGCNNKILPHHPNYFYPDSYTFLYLSTGGIYLSNLDGTINEFVFDLKSVGQNYVSWYDFDPNSHRILILADSVPQITNHLLTYNVDSKTLDTVAVADSSWLFLRPKFSNDYSKIAIIKAQGYAGTAKLCILQNGTETDLVTLDSVQNGKFSFYPLAFSPDDKYIAYSKMVYLSGGAFSFSLYVVNIATKETTFIDMGADVKWNPKNKQ